jgi:hypothetical protein
MISRPTALIAMSVVATLVVFGMVVGAVDSQATSTSKSICVDKKTKDLKLRKNCRSNESYFASADVIKSGGKGAYETWLELGNKGSKRDFINSLIGPSGSSGSSSVSNPMASMTCLGAVFYSENNLGRSRVLKTDWDFIERETKCKLAENQAMWYTGVYSDLNASLQSFDLTVTGPADLVQSTRSSSGHYRVPVQLDFEIYLGDEWIVCDSTLPVYKNSSWNPSTSVFDTWDLMEAAKLSEGKYRLGSNADIYAQFIGLGGSEEGDLVVYVCKEDASNGQGWSMTTLFPLPLTYPGDFVGLGIPYISAWGWE